MNKEELNPMAAAFQIWEQNLNASEEAKAAPKVTPKVDKEPKIANPPPADAGDPPVVHEGLDLPDGDYRACFSCLRYDRGEKALIPGQVVPLARYQNRAIHTDLCFSVYEGGFSFKSGVMSDLKYQLKIESLWSEGQVGFAGYRRSGTNFSSEVWLNAMASRLAPSIYDNHLMEPHCVLPAFYVKRNGYALGETMIDVGTGHEEEFYELESLRPVVSFEPLSINDMEILQHELWAAFQFCDIYVGMRNMVTADGSMPSPQLNPVAMQSLPENLIQHGLFMKAWIRLDKGESEDSNFLKSIDESALSVIQCARERRERFSRIPASAGTKEIAERLSLLKYRFLKYEKQK